MLGKLLKHEFHATSRKMGPLFIGMPLLALLASLLILFNRFFEGIIETNQYIATVFTSVTMFITVISVIGIFACLIMVTIFCLIRFYQNIFKDEGYLTNTLPVNTSSILLSKIITSVIWILLGAIITFVCIFVFILVAAGNKNQIINTALFTECIDFIKYIIAYIHTGNFIKLAVTCSIYLLVSLICGYTTYILALTLGSTIAKKHKVAASIGIYAGLYVLIEMIYTLVTVMLSFSGFSSLIFEDYTSFLHNITPIIDISCLMILIITVLQIAIIIASFFISKNQIDKHLNLE